VPFAPKAHHAFTQSRARFEAPESQRLTAQERGYDSRWQTARETFLAKHPLCVMCEERGVVMAATVVDHVIPHRLGAAIKSGNQERIREARTRFWDSSNWQSLCKPHHDGVKQAIERRSMHGGGGVKSLAGRVS